MKKFLFMGALAAMLLGTASCSKDMEPAMTDDGTVQFTIELPGNVDSRAISDGMTANNLTVAVYDAQGAEITELQVNKEIPHETTVQFKLVKGQTYSFAFWAQNANAPYDFDTEAKSVSVSYENATCNDETRDAFYAYKTLTVDGPINQTVYLTRPFAQLNFGADDLAAAKIAHIEPSKSYIYISSAATSFNLETGVAAGETPVEVEFDLANLPDATVDNEGNITPATLTADGKNYAWMAMSYFLVPENQANIFAALVIEPKVGEQFDVTVDNVPVQKNHRTNIVGSLFTEDAKFNVVVDQNFDVADYNIDYNAPVVPAGKANVNGTEYNTIAEAVAAADGNTIYLGEGTYNEAINVAAGETVSIHAGNGLNADDVIINKPVTAAAGSTLDMKNVTVKGASGGAGIDVTASTVTLDGVKSSGNRGINVWEGSKVTIKNSEMIGTGTDSRGINVGKGSNNEVSVEGSKIQAEYYAFNLVGSCDAATITVKDSEVTTGWAISNIWGNNNTVEYDNCTLNSINDKSYNADNWNDFSAFVYNTNASYHATNNIVKVTRCKVNVESTKGNKQSLIGYEGTNNQTIMSNTDVIGENTNSGPITWRATIRPTLCSDVFDNDWNFIGTHQMLKDRFNFENVTINWDGININWADYIDAIAVD